MKTILAAGTALALALSAPASAAVVTYTLTGNFDGVLEDPGFGIRITTVAGTLVGIGDTATAAGGSILLSSLTLTTDEFSVATTVPTTFTVNGTEGSGTFADTLANTASFTGDDLVGYSGLSAIGPVGVVNGGGTGSIIFTGGGFTFGLNGFSRGVTFAADVAGDVPEPATWGMMLLGFGLVGVAARRRATPVAA